MRTSTLLLALLIACGDGAPDGADAGSPTDAGPATAPDAGPSRDDAGPVGAPDSGPPTCGNSALDPGEACDPTAGGEASCASVGMLRGFGRCTERCEVEALHCYSPTCGDGVVDPGEDCDDGDLDDGDGCARNCRSTAGFEAFDREIRALMTDYGIPGGAVAVTYQGRLVHARGYGAMDESGSVPTDEAALFRIASLSKPITSVALHRLFEMGALTADARVLDVLDVDRPAGMDPRWDDITIAHLMQHRGGFDSDESWDPLFHNREIAEAMGEPGPAEPRTILAHQMGQPLDFTPGDGYAYSNLGYMILGLVVEEVTGEPYEAWVREHVLSPMGIRRMRSGRSRVTERAPGEVFYHPREDRSPSVSVFPGEGEVPHPDGGFYIESMAALGGWIASAPDLARFLVHVDGFATVPDLLSSSTTEAMTARAPDSPWGDDLWYANGWYVQPLRGGGEVWSHQGVLSGTRAMIVRYPDGRGWLALFNKWPPGDFSRDMSLALSRAVGSVRSWPAYDLFDYYP